MVIECEYLGHSRGRLQGFNKTTNRHRALNDSLVPLGETVRHGADSVAQLDLVFVGLSLLRWQGLRYLKRVHGQVVAGVHVRLEGLVLQILQHLEEDEASRDRCRSGQCRDNLAGHHLGLMPRCLCDVVVACPQVACGNDEVDVEVVVVVLLEICRRHKLVQLQIVRQGPQLRDQGRELVVGMLSGALRFVWVFVVISRNGFARRHELWRLDARQDLGNGGRLTLRRVD
mmetsp:Transcript_107904/g.262013  ORF Transcript_107904/g.262013 Transcript_107904/m.262013 type:complete len:229 (+) Transcript_107904:329-1015(+)